MYTAIEKFLSNVTPSVEGFENNPIVKALPAVVAVVVSQVILLLVGKFLWNNYLVKAVTMVKPLTSIVQLFAISVLLRLFLC